MKVYVTNPHGYCMGVVSAIRMARAAKKSHPDQPVVILGMLVHNREVVAMLEKEGIESLLPSQGETLDQLMTRVPEGAVLVFTAHGHDPALDDLAAKRGCTIVDATCVRVKTNMTLIREALDAGSRVFYIGQRGHPETVAALSLGPKVHLIEPGHPLMGLPTDDGQPVIVNQTTLSFLELADLHARLRQHFPEAQILNEICDATRRRQEAVLAIPSAVEAIFIVGSPESANTGKLAEIAHQSHPHAVIVRIKNADALDPRAYPYRYVAVASGASTPLETTDDVVRQLEAFPLGKD